LPRRCLLVGFLILTVGVALFPVTRTFAETGLYDAWPPPSLTEVQGYGVTFSVASAAVGGSFSSHVEDRVGNSKECFDVGDFPLTLVIDMPPNAVGGWLWVREYYPPSYVLSGNLFPPPRFLSGGGRQTVSGISYTSGSSQGNYAWRIGLMWVDVYGIAWWTVQIQFWKLGCAAPPPTRVTTQLTLVVPTSSVHPGESVSATASVSPQVTGGVISILYTPPKGQQVVVCSQPAAGGSVTCPLAAGDPGNGNLLATYSGYVDTATNQQYLQSQSSSVIFQVTRYWSKVIVSVEPAQSEVDVVTGAAELVTVEVLLSRDDDKPIANAPVRIEIQGPHGTSNSGRTNSAGEYSYAFTPTSSGGYTVHAIFTGDDQNEPAEDETPLTVADRWITVLALLLIAAIVIASVFLLWRSRRKRYLRQTWGPGPVTGPRLTIAPPSVRSPVSVTTGQTVCFGCGKQFPSNLRACPNCGKPL